VVYGSRRRRVVPGAFLSRALGSGPADDHEGPIAESRTDSGAHSGTHAYTGTHPRKVFGVR